MKTIEIYKSLRGDIEAFCNQLTQVHVNSLECKKGCCTCCVNLSVYPVEFHALKQIAENKNELKNISWDDNESCGFLKNNKCQMYEIRPIICMTHGLPILFLEEESNKYNVSHCELNFIDETTKFNENNTIPLDQINEKLYLINKRFISENNLKLTAEERINLKELLHES